MPAGGQVLSIDIEKGAVTAKVQGSRARPYRVEIRVEKALGFGLGEAHYRAFAAARLRCEAAGRPDAREYRGRSSQT